jgi:hypothetical protein
VDTSQTKGAVMEAHRNLLKRGELLQETNDKAEKLRDQSSEYASLAKQLVNKKKQENSAWGLF